jgi:colanic acid biosynthesis glycosyl transferase WcaI
MGVKQGLEVILNAAELSRSRPEIVYLLVGDGAMRRELESQAAARNLTNVRFLPIQPREQFLEMLAAADISLITQQRSVADIVFPSKTATLMSAGCPLIASVNPESEVARVVRDSRAGVVITPEKPQPLLDTIVNLLADPCRLKEMSTSGRSYARQHWDEHTVLAKMESELMQVTRFKYNSPPVAPRAGTYQDRTAVEP